MHLTVREALTIGPMARAQVIAGKQGLDRMVKTVTVMDTPDIANWVAGGELMLTNVYVIRDDPAAQVALVQDLFDRGAAALGVKLKRFVQDLPGEMLALASRLGFPIIEMPVDIAWIEVLNPVLTEILNRQAARLEESGRIHDHFTRVALQGQGIPAICASLAELTGQSCVAFDRSREILATGRAAGEPEGGPAATPDTSPMDLADSFRGVLDTTLAQASSGETRRVTTAGPDGCQVAVSPLAAGSEVYGYLLLTLPSRNQAMSLTALEHASTVATLEMVKARAVVESERRFRNDFLYDLLGGHIESREAALSRARALGNWDFRRPHMLLVADLDEFERYYIHHAALDEPKVQRLKDGFREVAALAARSMNPGSICLEHSDSTTILFPVDGEFAELRNSESAKTFAAAIKSHIRARFREVTVSVGIGRFHDDVLQWAAANREARLALEYGRRVWGRDQIIHYDDLGAYRLLVSHANVDELRTFADEILAGLDAVEADRRDELYRTLEQFFSSNRSIRETARALYLHVNTVRHRLGRVGEIIGFNPDRAEDCLNLEMALRIRTYIKGEESTRGKR